jgi:hypothetical protein
MERANMNANKQNSKTKAVPVILTICICAAGAAWLLLNHKSAPAVRVVTTLPAPEVAPPQEEAPSPEPASIAPPIVAQTPVQDQSPPPPPARPRRELHDPEAYKALALVGIDAQAEEYWLKAIFDTQLPDKEREDLMEDLNEVGFPDLRRLTLTDLPLIESRLQIIERIRPDADAFMQKHLDEAHKDLANMRKKILGQ